MEAVEAEMVEAAVSRASVLVALSWTRVTLRGEAKTATLSRSFGVREASCVRLPVSTAAGLTCDQAGTFVPCVVSG